MSESTIQSFRDLDAWKVAMDLTVLAYNTVKVFPQSERYELSAQGRAAVSVASNIASEVETRRGKPRTRDGG